MYTSCGGEDSNSIWILWPCHIRFHSGDEAVHTSFRERTLGQKLYTYHNVVLQQVLQLGFLTLPHPWLSLFTITNLKIYVRVFRLSDWMKQIMAALCRFCFYQTRSAWSMDQGSNKNNSPITNFIPIVTKFCVMWEGQAFPHDTKFRNCKGEIVDSRAFPSWSLIPGSSWSGLIKAEPGDRCYDFEHKPY